MSTDRRYSDEEVARILDDATRIQPSANQLPTPVEEPDGITLSELQDIAREVGIPADRISDAAKALDRPGAVAVPTRHYMGIPIAVGRTVELARRLTDEEWEHLVVDLRETFDARGRIQTDGRFRQWTNGNLQALLEPTADGERLRLRTLKGQAIPTLTMGAGLGLLGLFMFVLLAATQGLADPETIRIPMTLGGIGVFAYAANRLTLPGWADTRQLQMDGVVSRLTEGLEAGDPKQVTDGG